MRLITSALAVVCVVMFATGCGGSSDKNKMIARTWHITKMDIAGMSDAEKKDMDSSMKEATFDFRADGTTTMKAGSNSKVGKWKIDGDNLVLIDESGKEEKNKISKLTSDALEIVGDANGKPITVTMEPAK